MEHQDGRRRFIVLGHQYGRRDVMSVLYDDYKKPAAKMLLYMLPDIKAPRGKDWFLLKLTKPVHTDHLFSRQSPSSAGNITTGDLLTVSARGYFIFLSRTPRSFSRFARELADVFG